MERKWERWSRFLLLPSFALSNLFPRSFPFPSCPAFWASPFPKPQWNGHPLLILPWRFGLGLGLELEGIKLYPLLVRVRVTASSETRSRGGGGARESLNGRENMARRKVKNGEKSPWGQCLTRPFPNGRRRSGFWLVPENAVFLCPIRSQSGDDHLELVW